MKSALHNINFYRDKSCREPVLEYLEELAARKDKDSRIKLNKINDFGTVLKPMSLI